MRRALTALALVFVFAFGLGLVSSAPADAAPPSNCFYKCVCPGVPVFCCVTATGGTSCKPVSNAPIQCPQVAC